MDTDALMKRLRVSRSVRGCALALIVAVIIATATYCLNQHLMKKTWDENVVGSHYTETIIVLEEEP